MQHKVANTPPWLWSVKRTRASSANQRGFRRGLDIRHRHTIGEFHHLDAAVDNVEHAEIGNDPVDDMRAG